MANVYLVYMVILFRKHIKILIEDFMMFDLCMSNCKASVPAELSFIAIDVKYTQPYSF